MYESISKTIGITDPPKNYPFWLAYSLATLSEYWSLIRKKPSKLTRYRVIKFGRNRIYNDSKIRTELAYSPKYSAEISIRRTLEWIQTEGLV